MRLLHESGESVILGLRQHYRDLFCTNVHGSERISQLHPDLHFFFKTKKTPLHHFVSC